MSELIRKIEKEDLNKINEILEHIFDDGSYSNIERLGGMTNHSYKVTRNEDEYVVRIPGEGTEDMINRLDERKSTQLACKLGIDSELLYFSDDGKKVMKFIKNPQPMSPEVMKEENNIKQAADIFRKLHTCGEDTGVKFEVFDMADSYEKIIRKNDVTIYNDYDELKKEIMAIKASIDSQFKPERVPSHNDSLLGNWVLDGTGKLWLIDWEYSGMNEPMWDLSCTSIECDYTDDEDNKLLYYYFNREFTIEEKKRFIAAKLYGLSKN